MLNFCKREINLKDKMDDDTHNHLDKLEIVENNYNKIV